MHIMQQKSRTTCLGYESAIFIVENPAAAAGAAATEEEATATSAAAEKQQRPICPIGLDYIAHHKFWIYVYISTNHKKF